MTSGKGFGLAAIFAAGLIVGSPAVDAQTVSAERIKEIVSMSPEDMALTGAWTRANYDRLLTHLNGIEDPGIRELVLDMVLKPESKIFESKADENAFRVAPAAGGPGHHFYPGGLAVHAEENIEIAMGWIEMFKTVHGIDKVDKDVVVASLALHDWAKAWYNWNEETGGINKPEWYPASWGGDKGLAKWKWMGEHGALVYAEMMKRGAPEKLIVGTASAHFDPYWDLNKENEEKTEEGLNPALAEAAKLAGMPPIVVNPEKRMAEWWMAVYADGSWSFSHYVAGKFAHQAIREVAESLGVDPKSPDANKLASFVLTRMSDFKIYKAYQDAGFDMQAAKDLVISVLNDSSPYEVPKG